jgi:hypothetical protein
MTQHTPGPWEAKHLDRFHMIINEPTGGSIARTLLPLPAHADDIPEIIEGNARIMAAAPELLASVRELLDIVRVARPEGSEAIDRAEAAIVKADPLFARLSAA